MGEAVKLIAASAFGVDGGCQGYVSLHHQCEVVAFAVGGCSQGYGAGDVGGAVEILGAESISSRPCGWMSDDVSGVAE